MTISLIAAYDRKRGLGKDNALPWAGKLPRDMRRFRELTTGKPVIMGRKTFESIGHALVHRTNIVVTRNPKWCAPATTTASSLIEALHVATQLGDEVFVIGGALLFQEALPLAERMYLTEIDAEFDCDVFFPPLDNHTWHQVEQQLHEKDLTNQFSMRFLNLKREAAQ